MILCDFKLSLLAVLGNLGAGSGFVCCLSLLERAAVISDSCSEIRVFKRGKQLTLAHVRSTLNIEAFYGCRDLGDDGRLREREEDGVPGCVLRDVFQLSVLSLHGNGFGRGALVGGLFAASHQNAGREGSDAAEEERRRGCVGSRDQGMFPVRVWRLASADLRRAALSVRLFCVDSKVFCASTISRIGASPAW